MARLLFPPVDAFAEKVVHSVTNQANVRETQASDLPSIHPLRRGEMLDYVQSHPSWHEVTLPDGRRGCVSKRCTTAADPDFVIVTASTVHHLPRQSVVDRYDSGERVILRTDVHRPHRTNPRTLNFAQPNGPVHPGVQRSWSSQQDRMDRPLPASDR